jgi:hypothetical protein
MLTSNIIARFNLQVDDASELSSDEELALAQEVYQEVCNDRSWNWLVKSFSGTMSTTLPYITLPVDYKEIQPNSNSEQVVFVGSEYQQYRMIPYSARRQYDNQDGYFYIDAVNRRLYFTKQPTETKQVEYDYIQHPPVLTPATEPLVTTNVFGEMIAYGMAARFPSIEQAEKGTSYSGENESRFNQMLSDLRLEDAHAKLAV